MSLGRVDFDWQSGKAGARANIDAVQVLTMTAIEDMTRQEERLPEMASDDLFGIAHGRKVHPGIPAQQQIDVGGDLAELKVAQPVLAEKRAQQLGDADEIHEAMVIRYG